MSNSLFDHGQVDVFEKELIFWHIWKKLMSKITTGKVHN